MRMIEGELREEESSLQLGWGLACRSPSPWQLGVCVAEATVPHVMGRSGPDHGTPHEGTSLPGHPFLSSSPGHVPVSSAFSPNLLNLGRGHC